MATKHDLVSAAAKTANVTIATAEAVVNGFLEGIQSATIAEGRFSLMGFGTFKTSTLPEREGRNPQTGEAMTLSETTVVRFTAGKAFKDAASSPAKKSTAKAEKAPAKATKAPAKAEKAPAKAPVKKVIKKK
jgi:DNA-binding protein HU-beta